MLPEMQNLFYVNRYVLILLLNLYDRITVLVGLWAFE